ESPLQPTRFGSERVLMWKQKYELISFEEDKDVLIVRFARPDDLNAINARLHTEMSWLFRDIAERSTCKSVVLTGQGRARCAGGGSDCVSNRQPCSTSD